MATSVSIAKDLCVALEDGGFHPWMDTSVLLRRANYPRNARPTVLKILHKLEKAGVLEVLGRGKFKWHLRELNWNRDNPFRDKDGNSLLKTSKPLFTPALDKEVVREVFGETAVDKTPKMTLEIAALRERVAQLESAKQRTVTLEVKTHKGAIVTLKDVVLPSYYKQILDLAGARRNILLVGPAGCGKTHVAGLVAEALGMDFGSLSCTTGMSEAHLLGKSTPNVSNGKNRFHTTDFLTIYENGGVFLMDELDATDANLLLCINSAIANGYCNVPNRLRRPRAERHEDFIMIATANTFGRGANRTYAGRNQLDEATLDRFRIGTVECWYDEDVEARVCPDYTIRTTLQQIRERVVAAGVRRIVSTRFMADAYVMHKTANWTLDHITKVLFQGWTAEEIGQAS